MKYKNIAGIAFNENYHYKCRSTFKKVIDRSSNFFLYFHCKEIKNNSTLTVSTSRGIALM